MIEKESGGQRWLEFEQLQAFPKLKHGVLLRSPSFDDRHVFAPQQSAAEKLLGLQSLVLGNQVHKDTVMHVDKVPDQLLFVPACDGFMTNQKNTGLLVRHADCQAVIFFDPVKGVIANVHSGWRGSVQGILPKTVIQMQTQYGCRAEDLRICISPSLGPQAAEFRHYKNELPEDFYRYQVKPTYFDFWAISRYQLTSVGVLEDHIEIAKICTYSDHQRFYSYRRNKQCGFHLTCISFL